MLSFTPSFLYYELFIKKIVNRSSAIDFACSADELEIGSESWRLGICEEDRPVKNSKENVNDFHCISYIQFQVNLNRFEILCPY